jgi:hypothetical protein
MLASIDVSKSEAFKPEDRDRILGVVRDTVGISQLNGVVLSLMRDWVIDISSKDVERRKNDIGENHPDTLKSMFNLADLYKIMPYSESQPGSISGEVCKPPNHRITASHSI